MTDPTPKAPPVKLAAPTDDQIRAAADWAMGQLFPDNVHPQRVLAGGQAKRLCDVIRFHLVHTVAGELVPPHEVVHLARLLRVSDLRIAAAMRHVQSREQERESERRRRRPSGMVRRWNARAAAERARNASSSADLAAPGDNRGNRRG